MGVIVEDRRDACPTGLSLSGLTGQSMLILQINKDKSMKSQINLERIKKFIEEDNFVISIHARIRMFQRNVSTDDIKGIVIKGEIIEEYVDDKPCPSALMLGILEGVPYHMVIAECGDHVRIVTVYIPEEDKWIKYKTRR